LADPFGAARLDPGGFEQQMKNASSDAGD